MIVFNNVLISTLFNCMRIVWHFICFVWNFAYFIVMNNVLGDKLTLHILLPWIMNLLINKTKG
jgi:hypothetical protein